MGKRETGWVYGEEKYRGRSAGTLIDIDLLHSVLPNGIGCLHFFNDINFFYLKNIDRNRHKNIFDC